MTLYKVTAGGLNVRTSPASHTNDNLFPPALAFGTLVRKVGETPNGIWTRIHIAEDGHVREGWVASRYLTPATADAPAPDDDDDGDQFKPAWMLIAEREIGVRESEPDNPRIMHYLSTCTNLAPQQMAQDETSWCSAFVNWCLTEAGYTGTNHALARSWMTWSGGTRLDQPRYGAIMVFRRLTDGVDRGLGHVGFFLKQEHGLLYVLGGNQDDGVKIKRYRQDHLIGCIYPRPLLISDPVADEDSDGDGVPDDLDSLYRILPTGRVYELSLEERQRRLAYLEDALDEADSEAEKHALQAQVDAAQRDFAQAQARALYTSAAPPPHASNVGGRTTWRKAWSWATGQGGLTIIDPKAPYNDARGRNKPGEVQGSNIERVIAFLDVERTERYKAQGNNSFCTIYVCDATRLLCCEIPIHPNRAANLMALWLDGAEARNGGWRALTSVGEAQTLANQGVVVLAIQRQAGAGHVALVRPTPANKPPLTDDAYIAQAGALNTSLTRVSAVFGDPDRVKYYLHP